MTSTDHDKQQQEHDLEYNDQYTCKWQHKELPTSLGVGIFFSLGLASAFV